MPHSLSSRDASRLHAIAGILLRCFAITIIAMLFVLIVYVGARPWIYKIQTAIISMSQHELDLFFYGFLTLIKVLGVILFLFPFVAIRLLLRQARVDS